MNQNKNAMVTGAYSGIGREISRLLLAKGFHLLVINRNQAQGNELIRDLVREFPAASIESFTADLSNHHEIQKMTVAIAAKYQSIDLLFNNAGINLAEKQISKQGNEIHFEVNTVAPFLLAKLLKPLLAKGHDAVVVTSGSSIRKMVKKLDLDALQNPPVFKKMTGSYAQSKYAIAMAFAGLQKEFIKDNIKLLVVDLGPVKTKMSQGDGLPNWLKVFRPLFASPDKAAKKLVAIALDSKNHPIPLGSASDSLSIEQEKLISFLNQITLGSSAGEKYANTFF